MKSMRFIVLIGLISLGGLAGCDKVKGKAAVEEMCRKDGGLRINRTVNVRGFLNDDVCDTVCAEYLKDGEFEYVDIFVKGPNPSALYGSEGYFRLTRAKHGDPRCEGYEKQVAERIKPNVQSNYKFNADECLAIEKLPERPKGIVFYQEPFRQVRASNGQLLGVQSYVLKDNLSGQILATQREYIFTSSFTTALDMSGGGGRRDSDCHSVVGVEDPYRMPTVMIERALLNRPKQQ